MRLVDQRFAGIARGVGTAKILGRVHSAQIKLADLHLPCSFTIMEVSNLIMGELIYLIFQKQGRDVDLLLGLDMLKAHQACIDLSKNVLRIQGREVSFLSEHELPEKARNPAGPEEQEAPHSTGPSSSSVVSPRPTTAPPFPGGGHTLGAAPSPSVGRPVASAPPITSNYPEANIRILMDLGATRELAISTLEAAGGNIDMAASLLF